nr:nematode resistance protein-like HSPRO2 [Ipomoea batatas]
MEEPEREEGADRREHTAGLHPAHTGEQGKKLADHDPADTRSPLGARHCCSDGAEDGVTRGATSIVDLTSSDGTLARRNSSAEVWKLSDEVTVVSRTSEASLLPRLVTWQKSEDIAQNILDFIESEMRKCPVGLGEANLNGKPSLDYDAIVKKPSELHSLKKSPMFLQNFENQTEGRRIATVLLPIARTGGNHEALQGSEAECPRHFGRRSRSQRRP